MLLVSHFAILMGNRMIVRIQTREGQARVEVDPSETLEALAAKLQQQLPTIKQFKLSRDPSHKGD